MKSWISSGARACLVLVTMSLSACGGGDGGSGGGSSFNITLDHTSVSFDFAQGDTPSAQVLNATWTGTPPPALYLGATVQGTGLAGTIPVNIMQTSATISLQAAAGLLAGQYSGQVSLLACSDQSCTQHVGGTPIQVTYTMTVRAPVFTGPANISLNYSSGTTPPSGTTLNISPDAGAWTASASATWIVLSATSGNGAGNLAININPQGLFPGNYTGRVTVIGASATQYLNVTLAVTTPFVVLSQASAPFAGVNGTAFASQTTNVSLTDGSSLPMAVSSDSPWLVVGNHSASAPGSVSFSVNPANGPLASGSYNGRIHIELGNGTNDVSTDVLVSLTLTPPTLTISPAKVVLGGPVGRTFDPLSVSVSLNTGSNAYAWSVSAPPDWVTLDEQSGTASPAAQSIEFTPLRLKTTPGTATSTLVFSTTVNGDNLTTNVPVSFNLDTHRLLSSQTGVAFVSTPSTSWKRLTRTMTVTSNLGLPVAWTAAADQSWLTATQSGSSGDNLTLTADPTGLLPDQLYMSTVTISSTDTTVAGPEHIRVGLWVSSTTPSARYAITGSFLNVKADPVRPYIYAHESGATTIRVFNVYTGGELAPISGVAGTSRAMTISADGATLFALDPTNGVVVPIDLTTYTAGTAFSTPAPVFSSIPFDFIKYARPNGVGVVMANSGVTYLAATGAKAGLSLFGHFDATSDSKRLFEDSGRYDFDYTSAGGGTLSLVSSGFVDIGQISFSRDTATNLDGSRVYVAVGNTPYDFPRYNGIALTSQGALAGAGAYPNNVEVASDGRVFVASMFGSSTPEDVWVYDANNAAVAKFKANAAGQVVDGSLTVSGDGFIVTVATSAPDLQIVPIGP